MYHFFCFMLLFNLPLLCGIRCYKLILFRFFQLDNVHLRLSDFCIFSSHIFRERFSLWSFGFFDWRIFGDIFRYPWIPCHMLICQRCLNRACCLHPVWTCCDLLKLIRYRNLIINCFCKSPLKETWFLSLAECFVNSSIAVIFGLNLVYFLFHFWNWTQSSSESKRSSELFQGRTPCRAFLFVLIPYLFECST